ncbi:uncharacterized protein LOC117118204, partial [Anneissia japonica]|uniref:uncharacterized protein LOC117118204 n=1 Tax=Anneissia japonica TaxID=1529436 RepID=UPI0014259654
KSMLVPTTYVRMKLFAALWTVVHVQLTLASALGALLERIVIQQPVYVSTTTVRMEVFVFLIVAHVQLTLAPALAALQEPIVKNKSMLVPTTYVRMKLFAALWIVVHVQLTLASALGALLERIVIQ